LTLYSGNNFPEGRNLTASIKPPSVLLSGSIAISIMQLPFQLINTLLISDELMAMLRYRHVEYELPPYDRFTDWKQESSGVAKAI